MLKRDIIRLKNIVYLLENRDKFDFITLIHLISQQVSGMSPRNGQLRDTFHGVPWHFLSIMETIIKSESDLLNSALELIKPRFNDDMLVAFKGLLQAALVDDASYDQSVIATHFADVQKIIKYLALNFYLKNAVAKINMLQMNFAKEPDIRYKKNEVLHTFAVVAEALNSDITPDYLLAQIEMLLPMTIWVRKLRNIFIHPEKLRKNISKYYNLLKPTDPLSKIIFDELFTDLLMISGKIELLLVIFEEWEKDAGYQFPKLLIKLAEAESLFNSAQNADMTTFILKRDKKLTSIFWGDFGLVATPKVCRYLTQQGYPLNSDGTENKEEALSHLRTKAKEGYESSAAISTESKESLLIDILNDTLQLISDIEGEINFTGRRDLIKEIENDRTLEYRLNDKLTTLKRQFDKFFNDDESDTRAYRTKFIRALTTIDEKDLIENFYKLLADYRNDLIHHPWKKDYESLTNMCLQLIDKIKLTLDKSIEVLEDSYIPSDLSDDTEIVDKFKKAIQEDNLTQVEELLKMGLNVNCADKTKSTPLHYAANYARLNIVKCLLSNNASVYATDARKQTALFCAVAANNAEIIELLIENHANPDDVDKYGRTAYDLALELSNYAAIQALHRLTSRRSSDLLPVLVSMEDTESIIRDLAVFKPSINLMSEQGLLPLIIACQKANYSMANLLIENGADVNLADEHGNYPLHEICKMATADSGLTDAALVIMKLLLDASVNVNARNHHGETALLCAVRARNSKTVKLLLQLKANPSLADNAGSTPILNLFCEQTLHDPVWLEMIKLLLDSGVDLNSCDQYAPIIHHCLYYDSVLAEPVAMMLLLNGANPFIKNVKGKDALEMAKECNKKEFLKVAKTYLTLEEVKINKLKKEATSYTLKSIDSSLHDIYLSDYLIAGKFYDEGDYPNALIAIDKALALASIEAHKSIVMCLKALILLDMDKIEEAMITYQLALRYDPINPEALTRYANLLYKFDKRGENKFEILSLYRRAIHAEVDTESIKKSINTYAIVCSEFGEFQKAANTYSHLLTLEPNNIAWLLDKSNALHHLGKVEEATAYSKYANEIDPKGVKIHLANIGKKHGVHELSHVDVERLSSESTINKPGSLSSDGEKASAETASLLAPFKNLSISKDASVTNHKP